MTYFDERTRARDAAARLHGMLREVRSAPKDARDFLVFDKRDDWKNLGVDDDHIAAVDLTDDDALDGHIAQAGAVARALGHVDENDIISGGSGNDLLYGGAGDDVLLTPTRSAAQHGLRGSQQLPPPSGADTPTGLQAGLRGYQTRGGTDAGAAFHRTPLERFSQEVHNNPRNSLAASGAGWLYRKALSPAAHAAEVRRMNAEAGLHDAAAKSDPPTTTWEKAGDEWGKQLGAVTNLDNVIAFGAAALGGEGIVAPFSIQGIRGKLAKGVAGSMASDALERRKQGLLDYFNERD